MTSSPIQASKMSPASSSASAWFAAAFRKSWKAAAVEGLCGPRWMSEAIQMRPGSFSLLNYRSFLDNDVFYGHILVEAAAAGLHDLDFIDRFGALDHLAEYSIAPTVSGGCGVVQEVVVRYVDEELRGGRMGVGGARHGNGVAIVLQPVVGFIFDRLTRRLLLHALFEAAALNHEVIDDTMKDRAVVETVAHILNEVGAGFGRFLGVEFNDDVAVVGLKFDASVGGHGGLTFGWRGIIGCCTWPGCEQGGGKQYGTEPLEARSEEMQAGISHGYQCQLL